MSNTPIAPIDTPDPWILYHNSTYYLTFTLGDRIEIWSSPDLQDFHSPTTKKSLIYRPDPSSHWNADLWAPELHHLNGTWYIYFCAAPRDVGNPGHRTVLLRSHDPDPMNAQAWEFIGPLQGLPDDQWSIDATVFTVRNPSSARHDLYCCYSGWPLGDHSDTQQDLFLVRLETPEVAIRDSLTCISRATLPWERPEGGRRGVNEGPTFLAIPEIGFQGIVFSAHGSWSPEYKLGILALVDAASPCREESWVKRPVPLLVSDETKGPPFGPGHASFVPCSDGSGGVFCIYHGTERVDEGWKNRKARVMRLHPSVFGPAAMPVCCASGMLGSGPGGAIGWGQVVPPTEMGPGVVGGYPGANYGVGSSAHADMSGTGGAADAMPVGHMTGKGAKMWEEIEKKVPGQYRGYLDKVKKFF